MSFRVKTGETEFVIQKVDRNFGGETTDLFRVDEDGGVYDKDGPIGSSSDATTGTRRFFTMVVDGSITAVGTPSPVSDFVRRHLPPNTTRWRVVIMHRNPKLDEVETPTTLAGWKVALGTPNVAGNGFAATSLVETGITIPALGVAYKTAWTTYKPDANGYVGIGYFIPSQGSKIFYNTYTGDGYQSLSTDPTNITSPSYAGTSVGLVGTVGIEFETTGKVLDIWADSIYAGGTNSSGTPPGWYNTWPYLYARNAGFGVANAAVGGMSAFQQVTTPSQNYWLSHDFQHNYGANVILIAYGLNDLGGTTVQQTDLQMIGTLTALVQKAKSFAPKQIWLSTIPPAPWMTGTQAGYRANVNAWIRSLPFSSLAGSPVILCDVAAVWENGSANTWVATYDSGDTTHPSVAAHAAFYASAYRPVMP